MKGQASMEFFVLCGLAFFIIILFASLATGHIKEFTETRHYNALKDLGLKFQKEASIAVGVEDGYSRSFSIPDKLLGTLDFYITTYNNTVTINSSKATYTAIIPSIEGNFTKGLNRIEKIQGVVHVN